MTYNDGDEWCIPLSEEEYAAIHQRHAAVGDLRRTGALSDALCSYYGYENVYAVDIDGHIEYVPVYVGENWDTSTPNPDDVLGTVGPTETASHDEDHIERVAKRTAALMTKRSSLPTTVDVSEVLFNGPTFDVANLRTAEESAPTCDVRVTDYFSYLSNAQKLQHEAEDRLLNDQSIAGPLRSKQAQTIDDLLQFETLSATGVVSLLILRRDDGGHEFVTHRRPDSLVQAPGLWSVLPAGGLQTERDDPDADASLTYTMLKEMCEELFGVYFKDVTTAAKIRSKPPFSQLKTYLENGDIEHRFTSAMLQLGAPQVSLGSLVYVSNPEASNFIRDNIRPTWETELGLNMNQLPLNESPEFFASALSSDDGLVALFEGLLLAEEEYDIDIGLDIERIDNPEPPTADTSQE
jgi:hypothetical protein